MKQLRREIGHLSSSTSPVRIRRQWAPREGGTLPSIPLVGVSFWQPMTVHESHEKPTHDLTELGRTGSSLERLEGLQARRPPRRKKRSPQPQEQVRWTSKSSLPEQPTSSPPSFANQRASAGGRDPRFEPQARSWHASRHTISRRCERSPGEMLSNTTTRPSNQLPRLTDAHHCKSDEGLREHSFIRFARGTCLDRDNSSRYAGPPCR